MAIRLAILSTLLMVVPAGLGAAQDEEPGEALATDVSSPQAGLSPAAGQPGPRAETLDQAWAIALSVNQQLEAQRRKVSAAQQRLEAVRGERFPEVGVESSYTVRSGEPSILFEPGGLPLPVTRFPFEQEESLACRARLELPLYTSGRIGHSIAAGDATVKSLEHRAQNAAMDLKLRVAEQYVAVLRAQREVDVVQSTARGLESHLRDVESLFEHGQVPRNDVLAAGVN
jgi:outer membrane protein TolC